MKDFQVDENGKAWTKLSRPLHVSEHCFRSLSSCGYHRSGVQWRICGVSEGHLKPLPGKCFWGIKSIVTRAWVGLNANVNRSPVVAIPMLVQCLPSWIRLSTTSAFMLRRSINVPTRQQSRSNGYVLYRMMVGFGEVRQYYCFYSYTFCNNRYR